MIEKINYSESAKSAMAEYTIIHDEIIKNLSQDTCFVDGDDRFTIINQRSDEKMFCIDKTEITPEYTAFVLGKNVNSSFPDVVMEEFINNYPKLNLELKEIKGTTNDGIIVVLHSKKEKLDAQKIYDKIYD